MVEHATNPSVSDLKKAKVVAKTVDFNNRACSEELLFVAITCCPDIIFPIIFSSVNAVTNTPC